MMIRITLGFALGIIIVTGILYLMSLVIGTLVMAGNATVAQLKSLKRFLVKHGLLVEDRPGYLFGKNALCLARSTNNSPNKLSLQRGSEFNGTQIRSDWIELLRGTSLQPGSSALP